MVQSQVQPRDRSSQKPKPAGSGPRTEPGTSDLRRLIPEDGLREYWYPALRDRDVKRKPVGLTICGLDLVFFRADGQAGQVKCLWNVCPHRGGSLMHGDCHYPGTISCPYHGWTFDGDGNVLAVLPEGPESQVPGKVRQRAFPTRTLKGVVFVWMGDGEPAPIEEDVPEELFEPESTLVMTHVETWDVNWAVALENSLDCHPPYLHRNALLVMMNPIPMFGPRSRPLKELERAVVETSEQRDRTFPPTYQYTFPAMGKWPKHRLRWRWNWLLAWARKRRYAQPRFHRDAEWSGYAHHLPGIFRLDYRTHMYTRNCVPVDRNRTMMVYYHAVRPANVLVGWYMRLQWRLFHRWAMYVNFSMMDWQVMRTQRYDTPEFLSPTDAEVVALRRLLVRGASQRSSGNRAAVPSDE